MRLFFFGHPFRLPRQRRETGHQDKKFSCCGATRKIAALRLFFLAIRFGCRDSGEKRDDRDKPLFLRRSVPRREAGSSRQLRASQPAAPERNAAENGHKIAWAGQVLSTCPARFICAAVMTGNWRPGAASPGGPGSYPAPSVSHIHHNCPAAPRYLARSAVLPAGHCMSLIHISPSGSRSNRCSARWSGGRTCWSAVAAPPCRPAPLPQKRKTTAIEHKSCTACYP